MLPQQGGIVLCGVSGGRDSVCLLDYLHKLGQQRGFTAAAGHLNHLMRPTAQRDEDFVRAFCAQRDIPFYTESADVYGLCDVWDLTVEETGRGTTFSSGRRQPSARRRSPPPTTGTIWRRRCFCSCCAAPGRRD